jgi:hypothetical protein
MKKNSSTDSSAYLTHSSLSPAHWLARSLIFALIVILAASGLLADRNADSLVNGRMFVGTRSMLLIQTDKPSMPTVPSGPSLVSVIGRQIIVRKRNSDGTLALPASYVIRGVNWSPASRNTNTSPGDPNNANVRRPEFGIWAATDIPLIKNMNANTVRTYIDPGLNTIGMDVLDQLYNNGIMVVMTVDDAINDLARVQQVVNFYKDHPAILMWVLGNEWNINRYFGVATSVQDAAQRTQMAASLIKSLDTNHPVSTCYGEIDVDADGLRLADTQNYVNNVCTSVDVCGLNIYRGNTFGNLFDQWQAITPVSAKPMLIGEFGTDAFRSASLANPPPGTVDAAVQSQWSISEWDDIFNNLSANDPSRVATGGFVFEWDDEWWKVSPNGSQQTSGFTLMGGHPDDFANEEYFGVVDIDRQLRPIYSALTTVFHPAYQPPPEMSYRAVSRGALAQEFSFQFGVAWFFMDGAKLYRATGGGAEGAALILPHLIPARAL